MPTDYDAEVYLLGILLIHWCYMDKPLGFTAEWFTEPAHCYIAKYLERTPKTKDPVWWLWRLMLNKGWEYWRHQLILMCFQAAELPSYKREQRAQEYAARLNNAWKLRKKIVESLDTISDTEDLWEETHHLHEGA